MHLIRTYILVMAAFPMAALALAVPASAGSASPWSEVSGAGIRLLPGDASPGSAGLAGLEIRLDEGWKTYWRAPGDAGIPPVFDWSKSRNLGSVTVLWPAPLRFDDEGGSSAVYTGDVVLPLRVTATDPAKPVVLSLAIDYGICDQICVPAKGEAGITLEPGQTGGEGASAIAAAIRQIPRPEPVGASGRFAIKAIRLDAAKKPAQLTIDVNAALPAWLFVEGPEKWYLPMPSPAPGADPKNPQSFTLELDGLPKGATLPGNTLRFTLSTGDEGVESLYRLP